MTLELWQLGALIGFPLLAQAVGFGMLKSDTARATKLLDRDGEDGLARRRELTTMSHERERLIDENLRAHEEIRQSVREVDEKVDNHGVRIGIVENTLHMRG